MTLHDVQVHYADLPTDVLLLMVIMITKWSAVAAIYICLTSIFTPTVFVLVSPKNSKTNNNNNDDNDDNSKTTIKAHISIQQ